MTGANFSLGDRMKRYESVPQNTLMRRTPVILRLDGKSFSTFTRGFEKPFDVTLSENMANTTQYLVDNIQGAVFGYTQSDEISLLLLDYARLTTDAWYDYNIQKMTSISAALATAYFNSVENRKNSLAFFDSRVFNIPKEEVSNYMTWRQQDCTRNSIQACGQAFLGHKNIQGKKNNEVLDELISKNINWNNMPVPFKRGVSYIKNNEVLDFNMPLFKEDKDYINNLVYIKENDND